MARIRAKVTIRRTVRVRSTVRRQAHVRTVPQLAQPAAATVASRPAPRIPQTRRPQLTSGGSPVRTVGQNLAEVIGDSDRDFDVFVSHASPDKDSFVRPFAEALEGHGLSVWFDEFVLKPGSSLRRGIDEGIRKARYGIVVLSPAFLGVRPWTEHELDGLMNGYIYNRQVLLPIWHGVDADDVAAYSPSLADKVGIPTTDRTPSAIATEIADFIREDS